jgi:hypothetical protein
MEAENLAHLLDTGATFEEVLFWHVRAPAEVLTGPVTAEESQRAQENADARETELRGLLDRLCEQGHAVALRERAKLFAAGA